MPRRIVWDDENTRHLLVERADRRISVDEVEEILTDGESAVVPARAGRDIYVGRTRGGRNLAVVALGDTEVRPETAWEISEDRWREAHGQEASH